MNCIGMNIADGEIGKFSLAQLWNPVGSGKVLEVSDLAVAVTTWTATPSGSRGCDLVHSSEALGTVPQSGATVNNKDFGSSDLPVAEMRTLRVDPASQTGIKPIHELWPSKPEADRSYKFDKPLVLPPGHGLIVRGAQTAMYVVTSWQWSETPHT